MSEKMDSLKKWLPVTQLLNFTCVTSSYWGKLIWSVVCKMVTEELKNQLVKYLKFQFCCWSTLYQKQLYIFYEKGFPFLLSEKQKSTASSLRNRLLSGLPMTSPRETTWWTSACPPPRTAWGGANCSAVRTCNPWQQATLTWVDY